MKSWQDFLDSLHEQARGTIHKKNTVTGASRPVHEMAAPPFVPPEISSLAGKLLMALERTPDANVPGIGTFLLMKKKIIDDLKQLIAVARDDHGYERQDQKGIGQGETIPRLPNRRGLQQPLR